MKAEGSTDTWKNIGLFPKVPRNLVVITTLSNDRQKFTFDDIHQRVELIQKVMELADDGIDFKVSFRSREPR